MFVCFVCLPSRRVVDTRRRLFLSSCLLPSQEEPSRKLASIVRTRSSVEKINKKKRERKKNSNSAQRDEIVPICGLDICKDLVGVDQNSRPVTLGPTRDRRVLRCFS